MDMCMVPSLHAHPLFLECFIFIVGAMAMIDKPETRMAQCHHVQQSNITIQGNGNTEAIFNSK